MKNIVCISLIGLLFPSLAHSENRIDCYGDANGLHTYLTYNGNIGEYKNRLLEPLKVLVTKDDNKISFKSPDLEWFQYYIDKTSGDKYSSYQLSPDPNDFEWVKIAKCNIPKDLPTQEEMG